MELTSTEDFFYTRQEVEKYGDNDQIKYCEVLKSIEVFEKLDIFQKYFGFAWNI